MTGDLFSEGWGSFVGPLEDGIPDTAKRRAISEPSFDVFEEERPLQPKKAVGEYVAEQGFRVPLISDQIDWERAFDEGTAMLRSELPQDYDGLSGILTSEIMADSVYSRHTEGFNHELGSLIMRGLRSGELDPTDYMTNFTGPIRSWIAQQLDLFQRGSAFDPNFYVDFINLSASRWRFVEGANIVVFADPNVEGRYHFGVKPAKQSPDDFISIGGYQVEPGEHEKPQQFRKHDQPFVGKQFIDFYEQVRALPYFDTTESPVMELQQDLEGNIYFLQYLKTRQRRDFVEPFDLPTSEDAFRTTNVRGITPPEGVDLRMFMEPSMLTKGMEGQAIFCGLLKPRGLEVQLASRWANFILHEAYISFQDNHFDSSPLYRPLLAAALTEYEGTSPSVLERLNEIIDADLPQHYFDQETVPVIDIRVTSNGRQAVIESDWVVKRVGYADI